jgi:hypothetical protein
LEEEIYQRARTAQKRSLMLVAQTQPAIGNPSGGTGPDDEVTSETSQTDETGVKAGPSSEEPSER